MPVAHAWLQRPQALFNLSRNLTRAQLPIPCRFGTRIEVGWHLTVLCSSADDHVAVTPQPSTKHLTDEELKQQYGIHLTSRIQADGDGKEAKWADIDDDEDDWAPETIEWNDGTKSILTPADVTPHNITKPATPTADKSKPATPSKIHPPQFASSIGPNATVLKLGASAERQQAQKAAILQARASSDRPSITTKSTPAPAPAKSPWAALPPVDKVSPIAINPQPMLPPNHFPTGRPYAESPTIMGTSSPAKEMSADDFNRGWRNSLSGQTRELFMPNSGRYEAVPEGRRRMSRNDPNFRAPAVLQRPSQTDTHAPAEPSPAFQTSRTSTDQARRRASSTISGGSGQFGRRMSIKSSEVATPSVDLQRNDIESAVRPTSRDGPVSATQTPTYQARGASDYPAANAVSASEADLEVVRAQQRALMKENIERARKRKIEEEQRLEAEKQERIRLKLASLGPDPKLTKKPEDDSTPKASQENQTQDVDKPLAAAMSNAPLPPTSTTTHQSPPKPPQPLASGEPQQYGMMKVHPLDSVKKMGTSLPRSMESRGLPHRERAEPSNTDQSQAETLQVPSPVVNGVKSAPEVRRTSDQEPVPVPEPSPMLPKPSSIANDARSGWGDVRHDHRSQQTSNLWGLPNNKALGNGTFDQSLAGYSPQDLSRTSSTAAGWMNGKTPHSGRSPQIPHANHILAENRSYSYQSVTSPDQGPLAADSEVDSLFPTTKPAPIAPPHPQQIHLGANGLPSGPRSNGVDAWNNFHSVANPQERAEHERLQRDAAAKREEELRTGVRQGPAYTFNETWKQVQTGEQASRTITGISQSSVPASNGFGALGSLSAEIGTRATNGPAGRGSRFFPQPIGPHHPLQDRRAVTYSHPEPPRTPSPPPAEEYASLHPAFDGDFTRPIVHFPHKPVVRLPPAMPPTPPSPVHVDLAPVSAPGQNAQLTWAARVSMPAPPAPPASLRTVSTPIVQNPSWQERFNGLLGKKTSPAQGTTQPPRAVLAVTSSTKEPLDVQHVLVPAASVSLPTEVLLDRLDYDSSTTTKDVESEDDLFEDREPGSLPAIKFPLETGLMQMPLHKFMTTRFTAAPPEATSALPFMVSNWFERHRQPNSQLYALIKFPGATKSVKRELPMRGTPVSQSSHSGGRQQRFGSSGPPSSSGSFGSGTGKSFRGGRGGTGAPRSRQASSKVSAQ